MLMLSLWLVLSVAVYVGEDDEGGVPLAGGNPFREVVLCGGVVIMTTTGAAEQSRPPR